LLCGGDSQKGTNPIGQNPSNVVNISVKASPRPCRFYVQYCTNLKEGEWRDINSDGFNATGDVTVVNHNQTNALPQAFYRASSRAVGLP